MNIRRFISTLLIAVVLVAIMTLAGTVLLSTLNDDDIPQAGAFGVTPQNIAQDGDTQVEDPLANIEINPALIQADTSGLQDIESVYASIYEQVTPSIVGITVNATVAVNGVDQDFTSIGSGVVVDTQGHILTTYHILFEADEIIVNMYDGTLVTAEVVGLDPDSDLGIIRIDVPVERLFPIEFAKVEDLIVGQTVLAIGKPMGESHTLNAGIISALNRRISSIATQFAIGSGIQTDATINEVNSGGPLVNLQGQLVGINSDLLSLPIITNNSGETPSAEGTGIGFSIPADLVQRVTFELIENGRVEYSYIGIGVGLSFLSNGDVTLALIEAFNLPSDLRGVVVGQILETGPAGGSGLQEPQFVGDQIVSIDIITAMNGVEVTNFNDLVSYLGRSTRPNDEVILTVYRSGSGGYVDISLILEARPQ